MVNGRIENIVLPDGEIKEFNNPDLFYKIILSESEEDDVLWCFIGKPSAPIFQPIIDAQKEYWIKWMAVRRYSMVNSKVKKFIESKWLKL